MRQLIMRTWFVCVFCTVLSFVVNAQTSASNSPINQAAPALTNPSGNAGSLDEVRKQLQEQQAEIEHLRTVLAEQTRLLNELLTRTTATAANASVQAATYTVDGMATTGTPAASSAQATTTNKTQPETLEERVERIESQVKKTGDTVTKQLGSITFSGDMRLRYEGTFSQLNALTNATNPSIVGNELSSRNRARLRLRFSARGQFGSEINKDEREFQWGLRLASGSLADPISTNQTLTDFFTRKPIAIDQAYLTYKPKAIPGLRLQGGKFETPWLSTELTWDVDIQPEGINELYSRDFKNSSLKNLTFVAWQLPLLERQAAFVLDSNGRVNVDQSRRGGRDLALYGAQARARFGLTKQAALTLSAADNYYSGTQFITPAQVFGAQLQIPLTFTIPATATSPAQTITAVASISRDQLVTGNGNLGLSLASTNAVNRDGHLSSGFNLVDLIGRLDLTHSARFPVALIFNFVHNTQAHDVVVAGAGGANRLLPNHEDNGYWAEIQVGKSKERGDVQLGYTLMRIEKDAVLTPFNFSDIAQPSDVRAHRLNFTYAVDPRVLLSVTGLLSQRPHGLLGVFATTPPGSLNRATTRLQLDTIFRF